MDIWDYNLFINSNLLLMNRFTCVLLLLMVAFRPVSGQEVLIPAPGLNQTIDSVTRAHLLRDLNAFLQAKEGDCKDNKYVLEEHRLETSALLDEMKAIEEHGQLKDTVFYKPYLTNLIMLDSNKFLVGISYMGISGNIPCLRASFKMFAGKDRDNFHFYAPLKENIAGWGLKEKDGYRFYYKDTINEKALLQYLQTVTYYDLKIGVPIYNTDFYCCDNLDEALKITGIDYKSDYSGYRRSTLLSKTGDKRLVVNGSFTPEFKYDPHDLFHERLRLALPVDSINRPVDEGCAYLYGGSWGLSWETILARFKDYADQHPEADWQQLYISKKDFAGGNSPLNIAYVINALLVQKLEQERGFAAVRRLILCGKRQEGDDNYFAALASVMGIGKGRFNDYVWQLIKS